MATTLAIPQSGSSRTRSYPPLWGLKCGVNPIKDRVYFHVFAKTLLSNFLQLFTSRR